MNSVLFYKWMSKCYDLLDFIYFRDNQNSPRKVLWRKLLFFPVHMLEPKTYHHFVKKDLYSYFRSFDLEVEKEIHCNYSRVLILKKNTSIS